MKAMVLVFASLLSSLWQSASGQISLEYAYDYSGTYTSLKHSGDKFFVMDIPASQCRLYNMDHSLWKTINLPVPVNNYLYDVKYVSEGLFTDDERLALAYVYYSYDTSTQVYSYNARVITESGQELLSIPGCLYLYVHDMKNEGFKLIGYSYDFSVWPETVKTQVYSLPGQLATKAFSPVSGNEKMLRAFPNPATTHTIIPYKLPEGVNEGVVVLTDMHGQTVRTYHVGRDLDNLRVDTRGFPAGIYVYTLIVRERVISEGKLMVQR